MIRKTLIVALIAVSAATIVTDLAFARGGGGHGASSPSMGSRAPISLNQPKIDRPTINFTKTKLLKCHKYARGNGMGGVNWVNVCS
jgi:hypothetical protein